MPQKWEAFLQDERKFVSEARWDRFPEGSRIFIGNLSSERVSKKEVFDIFGPYGALAQISLKQAYGFVQYHTAADGQAAMNNLQGIEIKGRRVHLEFTHSQKKDRNADRDKHRGSKRERREADRYDGGRGRRDDYRPGNQAPSRRGGGGGGGLRQQNSYGGDRDQHRSRRGRSRSPSRHGRRDSGSYRQRSPDPYRASVSEADLDIPRRYGASIPDVQFLLREEVSRDFIDWAQRAFEAAGLRVEVMFLNPRFPRDAVIQRQVVEGVHAVVELDYTTQQLGRLPLQVFDRSAGHHSVRFDQYQDLDPPIAAQLVVRNKGAVMHHVPAQQPQAPPALPPYSGAAYGGGGGGYPAYPPSPQTYPHPQQPPATASYMAPPYPTQQPPPPQYPAPASHRHLDNSTLQQILGNIHHQQHPGGLQAHAMPPHPMDPSALGAGARVPPPGGFGMDYPPRGPGPGPGPGPGLGDPNAHVQNIMEQLSRYR